MWLVRPSLVLVLLAASAQAVPNVLPKRAVPVNVDCTQAGTDGSTYTDPASGSVYDILCYVDYYGGDMSAQQVNSFVHCISACGADGDCVDVSYTPGGQWCYLKSSLSQQSDAGWVWTARKREPAGSAPLSCVNNASNGTVYKSTNGNSYEIICGMDYAGGDLKLVQTDTFSKCINACDSTASCIDVSYTGNNCYMKSHLNSLMPQSQVWTAVFVSNSSSQSTSGTATSAQPTASSTTTSTLSTAGTSAPTNSPLSCKNNASDGLNFTTTSGSVYAIACGEDHYGGDLSYQAVGTFEQCVEACEQTPLCIDVSYSNGGCWMKDILNPAQQSAYVATAQLIKKGANATVPIPLTCVQNYSNGTSFNTTAGRQYAIVCGIDYFGGDLSEVDSPTFAGCLDACDAAPGCVDVSYSGVACYLKSSLTTPTLANWVWNARYIGSSTTSPSTSSFSSSTATSSTATSSTATSSTATSSTATSSTASTTSPTATSNTASVASPTSTSVSGTCNGNMTLVPSQDSDVDHFSDATLTPSNSIQLNYAATSGNQVAVVELTMSTPAVVLENSAKVVAVSCSTNQIVLTLAPGTAAEQVIALTGDSGVVLITDSVTCNSNGARGFYLISGRSDPTEPDSQLSFNAAQKLITDVATEAIIQYGTVANSQVAYTATATGPAAAPTAASSGTCNAATTTTGSSSTGTSTSTSTNATGSWTLPTSLADLSPSALELYNWYKSHASYDASGNLILTPLPLNDSTITMRPYNPADAADQPALQQQLQDYGLPSPGDLFPAAQAGTQGSSTCPTNSTVSKRGIMSALQRRSHSVRRGNVVQPGFTLGSDRNLGRRDDDDDKPDGWDYACDSEYAEIGKAFIGETGDEAAELVCGAHDAYDQRDAIACLFTGCGGQPISSTTYSIDYAWSVDFPAITEWLVKLGDVATMSCVNCGFSVSNIAFTGTIVTELYNSGVSLKEAVLTHGITGTSTTVMRLQSEGAWSDSWNWVYDATDLGTINMDSTFYIKPTLLYSIGFDWSTDSAIDVTGGASFSWNEASATINVVTSTVEQKQNWQPSVNWYMPQASTGAQVQIYAYSQWVVDLDINIMKTNALSPVMLSSNLVGLTSSYQYSAGNGCPANSLLVSTYVQNNNSLTGVGPPVDLFHGENGRQNNCINVPSVWPSPDEIASVEAVAGAFCTSYNNYYEPVLMTVVTTTSIVPSTTTVQSTTVQTITTTATATAATYASYYSTVTSPASTTTVTIAKTVTMPTSIYPIAKRTAGANGDTEPSLGVKAGLSRRAIATPTAMQGWPSDKISYACSQIATGTSYISLTSTTTSTSGITTYTQTITANANGPLVTTTTTWHWAEFLGWETATTPGVATATACPVSPANTKCFKLGAHGAPWVEGLHLGANVLEEGIGIMCLDRIGCYYEAGNDYRDTFYLANDGTLVMTGPGEPYFATFMSGWLQIASQVSPRIIQQSFISNNDDDPGTTWEPIRCFTDGNPCDSLLTCTVLGLTGFWVRQPFFSNYETSGLDNAYNIARAGGQRPLPDYMWVDETTMYMPVFENPWNNASYVPITFNMEPAPCPCY